MKRGWGFLFAWLLFLLGCGNDSLTKGGGGTNVGDEAGIVSGIIKDKNGPAAGALVRLNPINFDPGMDTLQASRRFITGANGKYVFKVSDQGLYNIEASHPELGTKALLQGLAKAKVKVEVEDLQMQDPGQIRVQLPEAFAKSSGYIYIPGTSFSSKVEAGTVVNTLSVPALKGMKIVFVDNKDRVKSVLKDSIQIAASGTLLVSQQALWANHVEVKINPGLAGITLKKDVVNFPLLLRLNGDNFSFEKARADGADIRFTKSDGVTSLPYEIERWDPTLSVAEIWVKVDTLFADSLSQSFQMHFGNSQASSKSEPKRVFESAQGYRGVWHLGENSSSNLVKDAAGNFNGILKAVDQGLPTSTISKPTIIGAGFEFTDWKNQYWIDLGENKHFLNSAGELTLSLWVSANIDTSHSPDVFSLSVGGMVSEDPKSRLVLHFETGLLSILARAADTAFGMEGVIIDPGVRVDEMFYVTGVMNIAQNTMQVYVNGNLVVEKNTSHTQYTMGNLSSTHGAIASNDIGSGNYFSGQMDELRLEVKLRSADWVKLCYENQRPGAILVSLPKVK